MMTPVKGFRIISSIQIYRSGIVNSESRQAAIAAVAPSYTSSYDLEFLNQNALSLYK
jgi:hypothetical protein